VKLVIICIFALLLLFIFLAYFFLNKSNSFAESASHPELGNIFTPIEIKTRESEILIFADRFEPSQLNITIGESVKWINRDYKEHTIILSNPPLEKRVLTNDSFSFQFVKKGLVEFRDKETGIKGNITVN
jgi:plastocyanin